MGSGGQLMTARGEQTIILPDGEEVGILFTNRALASVEERLGSSIMVVAGEVATGRASMTMIAHLLRAGMDAGRKEQGDSRRPTLDDAYRILDALGFSPVMQAVTVSLSECLGYDGTKPTAA
jgi:hypothetical protein